MQKKYIVRLSDDEHRQICEVIKKLKGSRQKVRRVQVLLKADIEGSNWTDERITEAYGCRAKTVENIRRQLVERGFEETFNGALRLSFSTENLLDGEQEARIIALRLGPPPAGYANWSLRLLSRNVVELGIVDCVSHEHARTVSIFMLTEPLAGWREVKVRQQRAKIDWASEIARLLEGRYAECDTVVLVCDQLNTHTKGAFYKVFTPQKARQ
jgi:hypothetical protein